MHENTSLFKRNSFMAHQIETIHLEQLAHYYQELYRLNRCSETSCSATKTPTDQKIMLNQIFKIWIEIRFGSILINRVSITFKYLMNLMRAFELTFNCMSVSQKS